MTMAGKLRRLRAATRDGRGLHEGTATRSLLGLQQKYLEKGVMTVTVRGRRAAGDPPSHIQLGRGAAAGERHPGDSVKGRGGSHGDTASR